MKIRDILLQKKGGAISVSPMAPLTVAIESLVDHHCGSLVVMQSEQMVGIITERDILRAEATTERSLEVLVVEDVMTPHPHTISPEDEVRDSLAVMAENGFRHLPVVDAGTVVGVVSILDLVTADNEILKSKYEQITHEKLF
ncbi:MAG: CBS domain-containing protein [Pirellulaceae bacterium]|nr:CBS domain-containing protein [Pirellulaceae bacterium]